MNTYLTRHQFGNAETEDLWAALEEASGKPVKEVMSSWTKQKGFPVISVSSNQQGDAKELLISQQRFCAAGAGVKGENCSCYSIKFISLPLLQRYCSNGASHPSTSIHIYISKKY